MILSNSARRVTTATMGALLIALSSTALAGNPPTTALKRAPVPSLAASSKEMRERMATLHEHMAACLRSDKSLSECHSEMRKHCEDVMGTQGCTRMMNTGGMMGMGCGMKGRGQGMQGHMTSKPPP